MHIAGNDGEDDDDTDLDLEAGFTTEAVPPSQTEGKDKAPDTIEKPAPQQAQGKKPEEKPKAEPKPGAEAPKFRQITDQEWADLSAAANKTATIEKQLSTALGTIGNLKQLVTKLQTATPSGVRLDASQAFKRLERDFPELATLLRDDFADILKGTEGTGGEKPKPSQTVNEDELNARLKASRQKDAEEALEDEFPKWRQIVGVIDAEGKHDPKNPYRAWLAKQTAEYQELINSTDNAYLIARSIRRFRKETAKPAGQVSNGAKPSPKQEARMSRISAAVPLKGAGGPTTHRNSVDDEFEAGFASERTG